MFIKNLSVLIEFSRQKQRQLCSYDMVRSRGKLLNPPSFCDCKYGWEDTGTRTYSESNGCPEMRNINLLLSKMTDAEYDEIIKRPEDAKHE